MYFPERSIILVFEFSGGGSSDIEVGEMDLIIPLLIFMVDFGVIKPSIVFTMFAFMKRYSWWEGRRQGFILWALEVKVMDCCILVVGGGLVFMLWKRDALEEKEML